MKIKSAIYTIFLAGLLLSLLYNCIEVPNQVIPTVKLATVTNITATTATSGGVVTFDGSTSINLRGVCWSSSNKNPTISDSKTNDGTGLGSFVSSISGLLPGTSYTIRAYAINGAGRAYSKDTTFTTLFFLPVLTTSKLTAITATTAIGGGNITNEGGKPMTVRGICWSVNKSPTTSDSMTVDSIPSGVVGTGVFADSIKGLLPVTTYYFRAYATNDNGTAYGNEVTATTLAMAPQIITTTVTEVTVTTARSGGDIKSDGGAPITARGICWGTNPNPTITDNISSDETGSANFVSLIMGLTSGTTYYIRAYATNSVGTGYGNEFSFTTL
jgi:hypothetical protein